MENATEKDQETARAILHYLQVHPDAKDTLEGIAQWWLLREWTERKLEEIERGVSILLSEGLIVERRREGVSTYYWLNQAKEEEISHLLNSADS